MDDCQAVALGEAAADLAVRGGRVLLPGSGRFEERDVLVADDRIAALPADGADAIDDDTTVVDAGGRHVVPGFVDAHTHLDTIYAYEVAYPYSLEGGTTTIVTEVQDLGMLYGAEAVEAMLAATEGLPVTVLATVPPQPLMDTFEPAWGDDRETERLCDLLSRDRVAGVGEIDWIHVVGRDSPIEALIERARDLGAPVAAHGAGCSGEKLAALAALVDNDHEAITGEGIVERVENGIHAIGRSGGIRDDAAAVADAHGRVDPADLSIASDGVPPRALLDEGHVDAVLRRVVEAGVPPADAIRMATEVPARHYGLDRGVLAPGRPADLVVLDDLETVRVGTVVSGGEVVVRDGEALVEPRTPDYPDAFYESVDVRVDAERLRVPDPGGPVRAIRYHEGLLSHETTVEPPTVGGFLRADPASDVCKATLFDRLPGGSDRSFTGFLTGFGVERGAVATTHTWEAPALLVVGTGDEAMVRAGKRAVELQGGWVVVGDDGVVAEAPAPIGGYMSGNPLPETADEFDAVREAVWSLGGDAETPLVGLQTLTFPGVPSLKLSLSGYADILRRRVVGLDAT